MHLQDSENGYNQCQSTIYMNNNEMKLTTISDHLIHLTLTNLRKITTVFNLYDFDHIKAVTTFGIHV